MNIIIYTKRGCPWCRDVLALLNENNMNIIQICERHFAKFVEDGAVGIIKEIKGEVVACRYCSAFSVCTQKDIYLTTGELNID
mgnify:CR=1 FL=1